MWWGEAHGSGEPADPRAGRGPPGFVYQSGTNWLSARSNSFLYTPAGDLQRLRDGLNHDTTWSYDAYGRPTSRLIAGTSAWTKTYNTNGWLTGHWTPQKGWTQYTYDEAGNPTRVDYPSDTDLVLSYDAANRLTSLVDGVGAHAFTWTAWGALASEDGPWVQDTITYAHNDALLRQSLTLAQPNASDWTQAYGYDGSCGPQSVTSPAGSFSYDYQGPSPLVNRLTLPNTINHEVTSSLLTSADSRDQSGWLHRGLSPTISRAAPREV